MASSSQLIYVKAKRVLVPFKIVKVVGDVCDEHCLKSIIDGAIKKFGRINVLVRQGLASEAHF